MTSNMRWHSLRIMRTHSSRSSGESAMPSSSISAKPITEVNGLRNSCEALATKSSRKVSVRETSFKSSLSRLAR